MYPKYLVRLRVPIAVFLMIMLIQLPLVPETGADYGDEVDEDLGESRILSEDDLTRFGIEPPSRSAPWAVWERIFYHRGGEYNGAFYHSSTNRIFVFGGGYQTQYGHNTYDDFFYYDVATQKWHAIEQYNDPDGRYRFSDAYDEANEKYYVYGGIVMGSPWNDLWEFDVPTMTWTELNSGVFLDPPSGPGRRTQAPMVVDSSNGFLYLHMGQGDQLQNYRNLSGFFRIDLSNPAGTPQSLNDGMSSGMVERYAHSMCIDESGRKIYLWGGENEDLGYLREFWVYDIVLNSWTQIPAHPDMSSFYGARIFFRPSDSSVYLWGGRNGTSSTENQVLWAYDTNLGTWSEKVWSASEVPSGRLLFGAHYSRQIDRFVVSAGRWYYSAMQPSRYRDLNYLDMTTKTWTQFPLEDPSTIFDNTASNGIFAYNSAQQRLYYIGPTAGYQNGTEYVYYWDLALKKWFGPYYNPGAEGPSYRYNAGLCYDEANNTVYMYGGGYQSGQGPNRRYYNREDLWSLDLDDYTWEQIFDSARPGPRQGFQMDFNENDGKIYMYGGFFYPSETSSDITIYQDFYKFTPGVNIFTEIPLTGTNPNGRYGSAMLIVEETNSLYLYAGMENTMPNPNERNDLWRYDLVTGTWTKLDTASARTHARLDFDPLTKELYMTGGASDDIYKYRILEDKWYLWYPVPNPGTISNGHASAFVPETRDLWVHGGGVKPGLWRIGIQPRLAIQAAYFKDPDDGTNGAFAMYRDYTFGSTIKTVQSTDDLEKVVFDISHKNGAFKMVYNHTEAEAGREPWTEIDKEDYAEVVGEPTVAWNGLVARLEFKLRFHWNWSVKANAVDRTMKVTADGIGVDSDELTVRDFLKVSSTLGFHGSHDLRASIQGKLTSGSWVQSEESITVSGPQVVYSGEPDFFPPSDAYQLNLFLQNNLLDVIPLDPGEILNYTFSAPNGSNIDLKYKLNITGVNPETEVAEITWLLNVDGMAPEAPRVLMMHADSYSDSSVNYDNDLDVYATWDPSEETGSGVKTYYWSFEDNGGTRDGEELNTTQMELTLPETGLNTIYVWSEDRVGNIGPASKATLLVDMEGMIFTIVSPNINKTVPYDVLDVKFRVTDLGGSKINYKEIQYRYTYEGQGSDMWTDDPWKYMTDFWDEWELQSQSGKLDTYEFTLGIGKPGIPKLSDSNENYIQIRAKDGAGSLYISPVYNIVVDTSLRFPIVNLTSPEDGYEYDDAEDVLLQWEVDFFAPEDVVYQVYISDIRAQVELREPTIMVEVLAYEYHPSWVTFGNYYWTVIPVARGQWIGTCNQDIWTFKLSNVRNYDFNVSTSDPFLKAAQGKSIPLTFQLTNLGQAAAWISPWADVGDFTTARWRDLGAQGYKLEIDGSREVYCELTILPDAPLGSNEMTFYFENLQGINKSITITIEVTPGEEDDGNGNGDGEADLGLYIAFGLVGIVALMLIIAALYFIVFKKKKTQKHVLSEEHMDRIEKEIAEQKRESEEFLAGYTAKKPELEDGPDIEGLPPAQAEPQEELKLVEEGSKDDWMNLVASETKTMTTQAEIVEDKSVHEDGKSLSDLLAEMSGTVEEEEP
ncbi:MAG: kelch repeat-containing protein [Thermoplasmatota archaeon]